VTTTRELHDARTHLHEILRLTAELPDEAITRGTTTSEAAHLNGATANPDAWYQRIAHGWTPSPDNADHHHPRWVLAIWDRNVRTHYGHGPRVTAPTITSMAAYIDGNLTDLAASETFRFDLMADALSACQSHLESVLHDGEQIESGAPCMTCHRPIRKDTTDPDNPTYRCTTCRRDLNANEYRLAVQAAHLKHADRLNVTDLADRLDIKPSTLRSWASVVRIQPPGKEAVELGPLLRDCGRDSAGRKVYRVAEALRIKRAGGDTRRSGATVSNAGAE
jgi:hypothetical protein